MPKKKRILKFEDLIRFSMPERGIGKAKIKLNMAGEVSMSSVIVRSISEANENMLADFRHSEDYKLIMIKPGENGDFKFPRTGLKKFKVWKEIMRKLGYLLPAVYYMEWDSEEKVWVGELQEVAEAPVI